MTAVTFKTLLLLALLAVCAALPAAPVAPGNVKTLKYRNSVGEIVKDLVSNWNSPIVYLRNRGYLKAPQIDVDMFRKDVGKNEPKKCKRSNENESSNDLGNLFRSLFSSNDKSISDKIKLKLGVGWDMDKLKKSVRNEAHKYYEKFYNERNQQMSKEQDNSLEGATDIEKQVAQLYPSVIANSNQNQDEKEQKGESFPAVAKKEAKFLNGIAKLLTNRELLARKSS